MMRRWLILFAWLLGLAGAPAMAEDGPRDGGRLIEYTRVEAAGLPPERGGHAAFFRALWAYVQTGETSRVWALHWLLLSIAWHASV